MSDVAVSTGTRRRRPRGVTAVVVITVTQALVFLLVGLGLVVLVREPDLVVELEGSGELDVSLVAIRIVGGALVVLGGIEVAVAVWLARGSDRARSLFGIVYTLQLAAQVYGLVALRDVEPGVLWSTAWPLGALWFLYGSARAQEYFAR